MGGMRGQKLSKNSLKEALGEIKMQMGELSSLLDLRSLSLGGKENEMKNKTLEMPY